MPAIGATPDIAFLEQSPLTAIGARPAWAAAQNPDLLAVLKREGEAIECPEPGTRGPVAALEKPMPNPVEVATLKINGQSYRDWKTVIVRPACRCFAYP